jgi:RluA family pseudouridine synthase
MEQGWGRFMSERVNESAVPSPYDGFRIDVYLARRFSYLSRAGWRAEIERGSVSVNGDVVSIPHHRVRSGDRVRFNGARIPEPPVDGHVEVLYEDESFLAVNKSGNLPVHPSGRYFDNTLLRILEKGREMKLFPVHRIDRETSGVILFAKKPDAASAVQRNFARVQKTYLAIVHGTVAQKDFMVDVPIGYDPGSVVKKRRVADGKAEKNAVTRFRRIFNFGPFCLVKALPQTGRLHQIRVHLLHAGHPIIGDKLYGGDERLYLEFIKAGYSEDLRARLDFPRSALHSRSMRFPHPFLGKNVTVKAPLPADFREFIESRKTAACQTR